MKLLLTVLGYGMIVAGLIWASVIGFYESQLPFLLALLLGGGAVAWVAGKIPDAAAPRRSDA